MAVLAPAGCLGCCRTCSLAARLMRCGCCCCCAFAPPPHTQAGHYVPNLAWEIVKGNEGDPDEEPLNLQGFLVGTLSRG